MPLTRGQARGLLATALRIGRRAAPGAELVVSLESERDANTRFARNEITSTGDVEQTTVTLTAAFGKRHAAVATNQVDTASLERAAEGAARLARLSPEDPEWMPVLGPQRYGTPIGAFDPATEKLSAGVRAAAAETAIALGQGHKLDVAGFYRHDATAVAVMTSANLFAYHRRTSAGFSVTARTADGTGSGWGAVTSPRASEIDARHFATIAQEKALKSRKPRALAPGRYTVVLEPAAVSDLLSFLGMSLDARRADEGRSFFSKPGGGNRLGEAVLGEGITLRSDPTDRLTPGTPFSKDGLPLAPTTWIDKGSVRALLYSRYWADKKGTKPTDRPSVFQLSGGNAQSTAELVRGVKRGVLITRFWYLRWVDPQAILVTGLTRDGTFLIENGNVTVPVNNFRFNESPITLLRNADALTKDTTLIPGRTLWRVPAVRSHGFNLASVSDAV